MLLSPHKLAETEAWLDGLSRPAPGPAPPSVRRDTAAERVRRWQGAATTRLNSGHWAGATGQPINAELSSWLDILRQRSEEEISKNALVEGMISTYTLCCLGSAGPALQIVSEDAEYNAARERLWNWWADRAGSNQQLGMTEIMRLWIRSLFAAGEFLDQFISVADEPGPVKLRLLPIHAHRLLTPPEFLGDHSVALGVRRDLANRRPICYYVSQPYILGAFEVYTGEFLEIPYRDLLHGFLMTEEDQVRGVPWMAPCLDAIAELRDYVDSTLDAARAAADWGVYLYSTHADIQALQMPVAPDAVTFERRQERYVPPGWQPAQVNPQQPPPNWEMFYKSCVQGIGRAINMPLMMILLDSSSHNYSSARFDGQLFWRGIGYTQGFLGRVLDRIEDLVAREAELAYLAGDRSGLPPRPDGPIERRWLWPAAPHVDPTKEREADRVGLLNGDLTYADICARSNRDWTQVIAERKRINEALAEAGLPAIPGIPDPAAAKQEGGSEKGEEEKGSGEAGKRGSGGNGWGAPTTWGDEARHGLIRAGQSVGGNGHRHNGRDGGTAL